MAINFGPIVAGPYTGAFNAVDVGFTLDGFKFAQEFRGLEIAETDLFAETIIDIIYRGSNGRLSYTSRTYKPGALSPYGTWADVGQILTAAKPIARSARSTALPIVLTSTPNTPAATSPATVTGQLAVLAPGQENELMFDSKDRKVPITLRLLPYESTSGTLALITTT